MLECSNTKIYNNIIYEYCSDKYSYLSNVIVDEEIELPKNYSNAVVGVFGNLKQARNMSLSI